jgi:hypothetical protein
MLAPFSILVTHNSLRAATATDSATGNPLFKCELPLSFSRVFAELGQNTEIVALYQGLQGPCA